MLLLIIIDLSMHDQSINAGTFMKPGDSCTMHSVIDTSS